MSTETIHTEQELRELDGWIEINVFGRSDVKVEDGTFGRELSWDADKSSPRHFSTGPAPAMQLLKRCIEFAKEKFGHSVLLTDTMNGYFIGVNIPSFKYVTADTWELAIAKFAKQIFSK